MPSMQYQQAGSRGQCAPLPLLLLSIFLASLAPGPAQGAIEIPPSYQIEGLKKPPEITNQTESYTAFPTDAFNLSCVASGNPPPTFRWTKDGVEFDPSSNPQLETSENFGRITGNLSNALFMQYQGKYRCYAANELGTAISNEIHVITEDTPKLPQDRDVKKTVEEGESLTLICNPPFSTNTPNIHWMDRNFHHIEKSDRVTMGLDGSLYFANAKVSDSRDDYACNAQYILARIILPYKPISLIVNPSNSVIMNRRPNLLQPKGDHSNHLALRGKNLVLECIPEGLPTPTVQWKRKDGTLSTARTSKRNFGRWLQFTHIMESDDGEYECTASNQLGDVKHLYTVSVEAAPYWTKVPESQMYAPGETVRLNCDASGIPTPNVSWSINGNPVSGIDQDKRRRVHGGNLILKDVELSDTAVYQCEASNKHGTILVNAYIHVIEIPPKMLTEDGKTYRVTEGQKANLDCETFGSPRPKVEWVESLSEVSVLANNRMSQLTNGSLQISNATLEDRGLYTCAIVNSNLSLDAQLDVLNRSVILPLPESLRIRSGETVNITCLARIDPQLKETWRQWRKSGQKMMETTDDKYRFEGPSLIIKDVNPQDKGKYTCEVHTSLDHADATVSIVVVDRPDAPHHLKLADVRERNLTLHWSPGDHHNSLIQEFIVEVEEQRYGRGKWLEAVRVQGDVHHAKLSLRPYGIYSFRVKAVNEVDESDPAPPTEAHEIAPAAPSRNPEDVQSNSTDPKTLTITWKEMDMLSFNGPGFKYKVMWKSKEDRHWHHKEVEGPPFHVNNTEIFKPFLIKVQAVNQIGAAPSPREETGYSGEDVPSGAPTGVGVQPVDNSAVKVSWEAVDSKKVHGHLLGYKIHLKWLGPPSENGHPEHGRRKRRERGKEHGSKVIKVTGAKTEEVVGDLLPFSKYSVTVSAFNSRGEGPHSSPAIFTTPQGKPGPPASLTFTSPSETQLILHWKPPVQVNGVLTGYQLRYQEIVANNDSQMQFEDIKDPHASYFPLGPLNPHSRYRFYLQALTSAGEGTAIEKEAATLLDGVPPYNISTSVGETYVNLSWVPEERHRNVEFQIEFQRMSTGSFVEKSDMVNSTQSFYQIHGLEPGCHYALHVFFSNKTHWRRDIKTEGPGVSEVQSGFATQGWFIGLISAIVLLLLVLLILCFIKRSKGGKYSVKDKEEGQVDSEARPMKDDTFGEYRSLESDNEDKRSVSQPSVCPESKLGSEDSLAEYGDSVDIQFNEDGSFIGQYSGHRDGPGPGGPDSSGATSPVNPAAMPPPSLGLPNSITGIMGRGI
ncbi:hypothetical protein AGOR_G00066600 [Albula goreensis]|uniref:Neural cell adhesion molecule L1 n=1 Tax=Albula goreensis TaxID=1534307 RepID=A0A8T3DWX9_9TELE|nr:hypothetical protein AGOR_G00066600 [Albula goreensis]